MTRMIRLVGTLLGIAGCIFASSSASAGPVNRTAEGTVAPAGDTVAADLGTGYIYT